MLSFAINTGRRSVSNRFAPALNRFSLSSLRRGLVVVLLGLPLWVGFAPEAAAQTTPMANADGSYTVPQNWALRPSAVNPGGRFRLMFRTTTRRNAVSANIADYNTHVQNDAADGHAAIRPYSSAFRVLASTTTVNARDNAMTTGTGVPIYWLGGARVADNYSDFHDGSWDSSAVRDRNAASVSSTAAVYTGSNDDGTVFSGHALGQNQVRSGSGATGLNFGASFTVQDNFSQPFFALSPVFLVSSHEASISLTSTTGSEGNSGSQDTRFQINMAPARSSNTFFLVCIDPGSTATYLREGRDFILRTGSRNSFIVGVGSTTQTEGTTTPGCTTVVVGANATSTGTTYNIRTDGDTTDEPDETVVLTLARLTTSTSSVNTPNGVGITTGRVTYTITDDDPTIVSLARVGVGAGAVSETGTIGLTVSLSRPLIAGEIIDVPLAIGGTGVTTDDWSLAPAPGGLNTGVTLSAQTTAMPQLRFSGEGARTATLVLSPTFDDTAEGGTETYTIALGPNDASANGFDLASRGTNVGGGADPHASANTFDVMVTDAVTHTLSISLDRTMAAEGDSGITDGATVTVTFDPPYTGGFGLNICPGGTATHGDSADWRYTRTDNSPQTIASITGCNAVASFVTNFASLQRKIRINGDTVDELDETVTLTLQRVNATPRNIVFDSDADSVTFTITDDDPAIVSLTRTGGTGAIEEGGTVGFTIALSRALAAGEIIDVPLSIGGTGVTTGDWSLAAAGTGVTLSAENTATPLLSFAGAGAETATLVLTPAGDNTDEGTETYTIALGPNDASANGFDLASRATNVDDGADPHASDNTFDVMVGDATVHTLSISLDRTMAAEGDSGITDGATVTITIDPPRPVGFSFNICLSGTATRGDSADWRYTNLSNGALDIASDSLSLASCSSGVISVSIITPNFQDKIRINGDTVDELDETVTVTLQRNLGTPPEVVISPTANRVTYTITDDDPTIVSLTRTGGTGAIDEGGTVGFTIALNRALTAGEIIDVPLSIGGTGVTADDWSLAADGTGVTLSAEDTATPLLNFAGAGAETATLVLTTTLDDTDEGGGTETYTIALGPNDDSANGFDLASRATNVGGGADPHASDTTFDVMVGDTVVHTLSISLDRTMAAEGDSGITDGATVTVTFAPPYTGTFNFEICLGGTATRGDSADWRYTRANNNPTVVSGASLGAN